LELLSSDPVSLDHLARTSGLELAALCGGLERLARLGVARDVGGWWERT
jgi:predicted transcriptional regulator